MSNKQTALVPVKPCAHDGPRTGFFATQVIGQGLYLCLRCGKWVLISPLALLRLGFLPLRAVVRPVFNFRQRRKE